MCCSVQFSVMNLVQKQNISLGSEFLSVNASTPIMNQGLISCNVARKTPTWIVFISSGSNNMMVLQKIPESAICESLLCLLL